jgi:hypothetical protein
MCAAEPSVEASSWTMISTAAAQSCARTDSMQVSISPMPS